jgi:uncharacterized Zn finger protein
LAAWVSGSEEYATSVHLESDGDFDYSCSCPYDWGPCKHAVAVVLAAAEYVKQKKTIPLLAEDDHLYHTLSSTTPAMITGTTTSGRTRMKSPIPPPRPRLERERRGCGRSLREWSREELVTLLIDLSGRYPEIERGLLEKEQLATGRVDRIVGSLRREIREVTAEPAWRNHWNDEGNLPDYSHVREQLQALLESGHADAVLQLGEELWTRGNTQVEQSNDEGDTATEIAECMVVVLAAVPQSSLAPPQQLM